MSKLSFLSRWFRKAPSPSPVPAAAPQPAPSAKSDKGLPKPGSVDRERAAAAEEQALQAAIDARDVQAMARLVVAGTSTRIRQAAAEAIDDPDLLRQLIRDVRGGNDKGVYRILTSKRDRLLEQTRKLEQAQAEIKAVLEALERHSQRAYDALYGPRLEQYESRWQAVAAQADPELCGKAQQWIERSRETVAEHQRQLAAQALREQEAAAKAAEEAEHLRQQQAQAFAAAAAEQERVPQEQKQALSEEQQAGQAAARQIGGLIQKARQALSDGSTSRAAAVRRAIAEKLQGAPPLPAHLASQLQQLDQRLADLRDWKSFSVAPKRAELIEEMTSLIGAELDPLALADRIKSLQDEWRSLGKGADENIETDWQRFQDAAQKAYQPCSEYFAAQSLVRQDNLRRRETLLTRLTEFEAGHDWQQPDWQAVIKALRETKEEWRQYSPVDRKAGKEQQERFTAVIASLQGRLDAEYARNVKQKEALIERAQQLLASDDARKAIEAIKELQQRWRTVGPIPREADQRLWKEFRQHCDAVFQKRQQEFDTYTAGLEDNKTQALALCEQLEQIAALQGPELLEHAGTRVQLRSAYESLGEFPRAESREIRGRFERAWERCEAAVARQHAREAEHAWSDLFEAADHVRAYGLAVARGLGAEQIEPLKAAAEACIASVQRWPRNGLETLKQALAREPSADFAANEAALRMLCIRAEILTDTPTPPEDQALRRDYQLQRLVQGLGQGVRADEMNLDALAIEWVAIGPVEKAVYEPLLRRFRRCRECNGAGEMYSS